MVVDEFDILEPEQEQEQEKEKMAEITSEEPNFETDRFLYSDEVF